MKAKLLILVIVMLFSCNITKKTEMNDVNGRWILISFGDDLVENKCNGCPKIEFTKDEGKIIYTSNEEMNFTYSLNADNKSILFFFDTNQDIFEENKYHYKIYMENNLEILELSNKDKSSIYIWGRAK